MSVALGTKLARVGQGAARLKVKVAPRAGEMDTRVVILSSAMEP